MLKSKEKSQKIALIKTENFLKDKIEEKNSLFLKGNENKCNKKHIQANKLQLVDYKKIIQFLIVINIFIKTLERNELHFIELKNSKITLKIKGIGYNKIYNYYTPNETYINGIKQKNISSWYNLNKTDNVIELIWNNALSDIRSMFRGCVNITEMNLSNFETSKLKKPYLCFIIVVL